MCRERRKLEEKVRKEMANLERNDPGNSHGGSLDTVNGNTGARTNYHSDTSGRKQRDIVEVITLIGSDDDSEEEEVRFVRKKRRGQY